MKPLPIESPILKEIDTVRHFFSTREGGVSDGRYESLNLSYDVGDIRENVDKNFDLLSSALGIRDFYWSVQAHTDKCVVLSEANKKEISRTKADAMITNMKGAVIGVRTADCCPILIADEDGKAVGAVHAGWKSTVFEILTKTISQMREVFGLRPSSLKLSIGPSIGKCCYMIDGSRARHIMGKLAFAKKHISKGGGYRLDLKGLNRDIALRSGVLKENIDTSGLCTCCSKDLFFSYRRDGGSSGRHYSGIWIC